MNPSDKPKSAPDVNEPLFIRHPSILPPLGDAEEAVIQARTAVFKPGVSVPPDNVSLMDIPSSELLRAVAKLRGIPVPDAEEGSPDEDEEFAAKRDEILDVIAELEKSAPAKKGPARSGRRKGKDLNGDEKFRENWHKKPENPGVAVARLADIGRAVLRKMITRKEAMALADPLIASFGNNPTKAMEGVMKEFGVVIGKAGSGMRETEVSSEE